MASRKRQMLQGLFPDRDIIDKTAAASVEHLIVDDVYDTKTTHTTRSTRNGRPSVTYDMKYYPMDVVTRPNAPATQRNRSDSVSFADRPEQPDNESELIEFTPADELSDSDSSEVASVSPSLKQSYLLPPPPGKRTKDPNAKRHSSRAEAKKFVHYDVKSHPSDYALPGYRHRAKYAPPSESLVPSKKPKKRRIRGDPASDAEQPDMSASNALSRPRKKLKSLRSRDKKTSKPNTSAKRGGSRRAKSSLISDDVEDTVDQAIQGSQVLLVVLSSGVDELEQVEDDIAGAFEDMSSAATDQDTQDAACHLPNAMGSSSEISDAGPDHRSTPKQTERSIPSLASLHRFPEYSFDRHVFGSVNVSLTTDAAFEGMLEDFRTDHDVELAIQKPYLTTAYTSNSMYGTVDHGKATSSSPASHPSGKHFSQIMDLNNKHKLEAFSKRGEQSDDGAATAAHASQGCKHSLADKEHLALGLPASSMLVDQRQDADSSPISADTAENSRSPAGHDEIQDSDDGDNDYHSPVNNPTDTEYREHDGKTDCSSHDHFTEQIFITESRFESGDGDRDDIGLQEISKWHHDDKNEDNESCPGKGSELSDLPCTASKSSAL